MFDILIVIYLIRALADQDRIKLGKMMVRKINDYLNFLVQYFLVAIIIVTY